MVEIISLGILASVLCASAACVGLLTSFTRGGVVTWVLTSFDGMHPAARFILRNWKAPKLPAALYAWACSATGPLIGGEGWYESEPWEARQGLAEWWDIRSGEDAAATVSELLRGPVAAWSRVRAIHVAIAACRCELLGPEWTWQAVLHAARELQQSYPSFDAIASDYLRARREWARLPVDGTADDAQQRGCVARVAALQKRRWDGVPFDAFLHV